MKALIDYPLQAAAKNLIHKNNAARKVSRLTKAVNGIQ